MFCKSFSLFLSIAVPLLTASSAYSSQQPLKGLQDYIKRGRELYRTRKFDKAEEIYSLALKKFPHSAQTYQLRASANIALGRYQKAIDDFTSAIKIAPANASLYQERADAYYSLVQQNNAIDDSMRAIKLNPALASGYRTASQAFEELGLCDKAIELRTELIRLKISDALDWSNRAKNYESAGKFSLAKADRQKAISLARPSEREQMQLSSPLINFANLQVVDSTNSIAKQLNGRPVVLPFHYDEYGHMYVSVMVNSKPLNFMMDTGCSESSIFKKDVVGIGEKNTAQLQKLKNLGDFEYGFFKIRELKLGDFTLSNIPVSVVRGLRSSTLSGFLGANILENFAVSIDYSTKQITLAASSKHQKSEKAIVVPLMVRHHLPYCTVKLDDKLKFEALLDTGLSSMAAADALVEPILHEKLICNWIFGGPWIGSAQMAHVHLKSLEVGSCRIDRPIFEVFLADGAPHAAGEVIIGNSFLGRFKTVTFDYPARQLILEPREDTVESPESLFDEGLFNTLRSEEKLAIEAFSKGIELDKDLRPKFCMYRARCYKSTGQLREAILDLDTVLKLEPTNLFALKLRSEYYRDIGDYARQIADATTLLRLKPDFYYTYLARADAYDKLGNHRLAERDRRTAVQYKNCKPEW
ncbi:MAG: aspartyl protease family protein [Candidatus Obscuribacterales bacterium]|jgi:tetratricopeptide (TPR) repeat protein